MNTSKRHECSVYELMASVSMIGTATPRSTTLRSSLDPLSVREVTRHRVVDTVEVGVLPFTHAFEVIA